MATRFIKNVLGCVLLCIGAVLTSGCDEDRSGYSIGDLAADWGTVRASGAHQFHIEGDRWGKLWLAGTDMPWYLPNDGQRVIVYFNPLYNNYPLGYDCSIKLMRVHEILTKKVETPTSAQEEEMGDDPIRIRKGNIWIDGKHYLNLLFEQNLPARHKHRISLVAAPRGGTGPLDYLPLTLRYNTYADTTGVFATGAVSFDLSEYMKDGAYKGVVLSMHSAARGHVKYEIDLRKVQKSVERYCTDMRQAEVE